MNDNNNNKTPLFNNVSNNLKHAIIFDNMSCDETKNIYRKDTRYKNPLCECIYSCENEKCDFTKCLMELNKINIQYKDKATEYCKAVIEDIDENQESYLPAFVDRYYINSMGKPLILLKNEKNGNNSVYGIIEYNDVKKTILKGQTEYTKYRDIEQLSTIISKIEKPNEPYTIGQYVYRYFYKLFG